MAKNFKTQQLEILNHLGDVLSFSYDLQAVNRLAKQKPKEMVKCAENFYKWQIDDVAQLFVERQAKIMFLAGGSSAGKTTSAINIKNALKKFGKIARVISMDDFFLNMEDRPKNPDGSYDSENIEALDIPCFKKFLKNILNGQSALLPSYDFVSHKRGATKTIKLKENEVLIFEGLHALNPLFHKTLPKNSYFKVYVSVISNFTVGTELIIDAHLIRFMRRLLRDYYKRGMSISKTVEMWRKVRQGEEKFIIPFRNDADYLLNTTHMYEPLLYDKYLSPIIKNDKDLKEIAQIINVFNHTGTFSEKYIPKHSLIREFMREED